ncbi:MAG: amino acid permease [Planctomycetes bacterium]|nr:amino acid permease [Planctomycetota bacterium]
MMGLGSILGTGVFVSVGIAAGVAGPAVVLAIALAGVLAVCNALSSAQLAASHPVSGGTYEYGYRYLTPTLGFGAGWMFLCAKSASAATAALGFAGYTLHAAGVDSRPARTALALGAVVVLTGLVLAGVRRSNRANTVIVGATLVALAFFVVAGLRSAVLNAGDNLTPFFGGLDDSVPATRRLLEATALMFVAYTGYGRIATLGEEVAEPRRTIPRAIVITLIVSMTLYIAVGLVGVAGAGVGVFAGDGTRAAAPLEVAARSFGVPGAGWVLAAGAVTAMLGVLLNLILGLSRVALAMGRRGDLPGVFARVSTAGSPGPAVVGIGLVIALIAATGDIRLAWSFSAFTVLVYYAVTNLAATRLAREDRLYHPLIAWFGLAGCLGLAFWVESRVWIAGLGVLAAGLLVRWVMRRVLSGSRPTGSGGSPPSAP